MASEYVYRAYGRDGKVETGAIEAISEAAAAAMLTRRGLSVFEIRPEAASGKSWLERDIFAGRGYEHHVSIPLDFSRSAEDG